MCAKGFVVGFLFFFFILAKILAIPQCSGSLNVYVVYEDTGIKHVALNGVGEVSSVAVGMPYTVSTKLPLSTVSQSHAGENGIADYLINTLIYPAGRLGLNSLYMFDMGTRQWSDIDTYCKPIGVAYFYYDVVGFCDLISNPTPCVPYFKMQRTRDGQWRNGSSSGLCSYGLSTTNLTNPVILTYDSQYAPSVKLYFAEQETGMLHEIHLGQQESRRYIIPYQGMNINRIVPAVAKDGSFTGIRIESLSPNTINHVLFSSTAYRFTQTNVQTETIAFDSYNLNYLVSFTTSLRTMIVTFRNGTTRQYPLAVTLDDPVQCENVVGPVNHYLICLAGGGFSPIIIDVTSGTSKAVPVGEFPVAKMEMLSENTFYLLNSHQELSFYIITNSSAVHIGTYTVRSNSNFSLMGFNSNITCNVNHTIATESNNTVLIENKPNNQTNHTGNLSDDTDEIVPTNTSTNGTNPTGSTGITSDSTEETSATSHPSISGNIKESNNLGVQSEQNKKTNITDKVVIGVSSVLIVVLIVTIGVSVIVFRRRICCHYGSEKLTFSSKTVVSTLSPKDDNSQQDSNGKDAFSRPVDKGHYSPDIPGIKPTSLVQGSSSLTGGTCCDNKSEKFVTYLDPDRESIKSPLPCSDAITCLPPTPESRIGPDGTDKYTN